MTLHTIDVIDIEPVEHFSFLEIAKLCALSEKETEELIDYGAIKADYSLAQEDYYSPQTLEILKVACRQRTDYDLDLFSVVICVQYLREIVQLKQEIQTYKTVLRIHEQDP
jgi:hypothetical protein